MGLRAGLIKSELKLVRDAYDSNAPIANVAKRFRVKPVVIKKCYASFKAADAKATEAVDPAGDNDDL